MLDLSDRDQLFDDPCKHFSEGDLYNPGLGPHHEPCSDAAAAGDIVREDGENELPPEVSVMAELDADDT